MRPVALLLIAAFTTGPNIIDLQPFRRVSSARGATLINLNPAINAWFLLAAGDSTWHLENPQPREQQVMLDDKSGFVIAEGKDRYPCDLLSGALDEGRKSTRIYYPLCGGRLWLRNPAKGQRTALESATEFLRNQVWGGEKVIILFHHLLSDRWRETGDLTAGSAAGAATAGPGAALIDSADTARLLKPVNLGITLESPDVERNGMTPGAWYPAAGNPGVYVSVLQPNIIAPAVMESHRDLVSHLDNVEGASLVYLIAFDLDRYDLGFAMGTNFPGVGWSTHLLPQMKDASLPGPDGIGSIAPLVSTGLISPENGRRTVAAFTGGFKREHGAFKFGDLAMENHGSHYGFLENGVVFSKLQPGLATVFVLNDGAVEMKTWSEADNALLGRIRYARQNGVPIIESGAHGKGAAPGKLVARWGPGNWSGSEDEKLRTIRAGLAVATHNAKRWLIYAVFSDATPSAMARVFQAYQTNYAMLTDMNALEHTYLALYRRAGSEMAVDHLISGMSVLDKGEPGAVIPRFLGVPDNRDFFYVMRKETKP
jgi:hypothetical protein